MRFKTGLFQSTHPHGVRPSSSIPAPQHNLCFNPRTRTGCDVIDSYCYRIPEAFQSTHPHGVRRLELVRRKDDSYVSIHAPARGAT